MCICSIYRVPTIRENQGKSGKNIFFWKVRESQGISIFFVESQGKSGKMIWLRWTKVCPWFLGIKPSGCRCKIFPRFARDFTRYPSDLCHEVRESQGKLRRKVRESQGIQIELTGGNPVSLTLIFKLWATLCTKFHELFIIFESEGKINIWCLFYKSTLSSDNGK